MRPTHLFALFFLLVPLGSPVEPTRTEVRAKQGQLPEDVPNPSRELVVLLHGMGRTSYSMVPLKEALEEAGYDVLNIGYSSTCCAIAELGEIVREQVAANRGTHTRVHFVGHSLGAIIARLILSDSGAVPGAGRLVMLAPPNQGSKSADFFAPVAGWLLEPMDELRTDSTSTVRRMPTVRGIEVGVIAARNDGKVLVDDTHLPNETAHVVVDGYHTFIMRREDVHQLTIHFLREGRFVVPFPSTDDR